MEPLQDKLIHCQNSVHHGMGTLVWKHFGLMEEIRKACVVDRAGESVLEFLLCMPDIPCPVLGQGKFHEIVATTAWYLWYERRKLTHDETTQTPSQISLAIRSLAANFEAACKPKSKP